MRKNKTVYKGVRIGLRQAQSDKRQAQSDIGNAIKICLSS
ncbi:hypothetical protein CJ739_975 [Mariniflexile rhizosphaerae]|nr:hypothetical protein CJ739_975 [Mariniflexile sp. TRM1-10]